MKTQFRASFAKDLKNAKNKNARRHIKDTIEQIERAQTLQDMTGVKTLKGAGDYYRIRVGEYRLGIMLEGDTVVFVRCLDRKDIYRYFPFKADNSRMHRSRKLCGTVMRNVRRDPIERMRWELLQTPLRLTRNRCSIKLTVRWSRSIEHLG